MCGKWCDLGSHSYFCSTCIDEWSATFTAQQEQKSYAEEQEQKSYAEEQDSPRPLAVAAKRGSPESEDQNKAVPQATLWSPATPSGSETS
jgi:hypothetical protein